MKQLLNKILDFLFPIRCLKCRQVNCSYICNSCVYTLPRNLEKLNGETVSIFDYSDKSVRRLLWMLKYRNRYTIARSLGAIMYDATLEELSEREVFDNFTNPVLIPIPLSRKKKRLRGYNQSELLARALSAQDPKLFTLETNALIKSKETPSQVSIKNKRERRKNIKGSFAVKNPESVQGRNIILIDDVTTTGATLSEARKILNNAGAKNVIAITVAH